MIEISSDFEGGNAVNIKYRSNNHIVFSARKGRSPSPLWFYFRAKGLKDKKVTFELENAHDVKNDLSYIDDPENWTAARPVYTYDKKRFRRMAPGIYEKGSYIFSHKFSHDEAFMSYSYPYVYSDLSGYLKNLQDSPFCRIANIGKTEEGKSIPYLQISDFSTKTPKRSIWIIARQHAGETPGSYVCEGIINTITADSKFAQKIRTDYIFNIIPMVDIDNVYQGNYGKDSEPVDFNRDWNRTSIRKEIKLIKKYIETHAAKHRIDAFFDLHAPGMSQGNGYHSSLKKGDNAASFKREFEFAQLLMKFSPSRCPYIYAKEGGTGMDGMAIRYIYQKYNILSVILENSYHRPLRNKNLYTTPDSMRQYGTTIVKAISQILK